MRIKAKRCTTVKVPVGPGDVDLLAAALDAVTESNMQRMASSSALPCCVNCGEFDVVEPSEASHASRLVAVRGADDVARTGAGTCAELACYDAAQANLELGEKNSVKLAVQQYQKALELDPDNRNYKDALKDAQLTWEADWA